MLKRLAYPPAMHFVARRPDGTSEGALSWRSRWSGFPLLAFGVALLGHLGIRTNNPWFISFFIAVAVYVLLGSPRRLVIFDTVLREIRLTTRGFFPASSIAQTISFAEIERLEIRDIGGRGYAIFLHLVNGPFPLFTLKKTLANTKSVPELVSMFAPKANQASPSL